MIRMPDSPKGAVKDIRVKSEMELLRERNIKVRDDFFFALIKDDPDYEEAMKNFKDLSNPAAKKPRVQKKTGRDPSVSFRIAIPLKRRRSARLQNKKPDIVDTTEAANNGTQSQSDTDDLEDIVYKPKKRTIRTVPSTRKIIPVDEVGPEMLAKIAKKQSDKIYSSSGTTCHQCRQKTLDQKTCCRNTMCVGLRGQICGMCLDHRYGEQAAVALKDANWHCPVCRDICNCSICRTRAGKRPTGILAPMAIQKGHNSVKDFLDSLNGKGDYADKDEEADQGNNMPGEENQGADLLVSSNDVSSLKEGDFAEEDKMQHDNREPGLLGFSDNGNIAHAGDDAQKMFEAFLNVEQLDVFCKDKEAKLTALEEEYKKFQGNNVLGFVMDSNVGLLQDNTQFELVSLLPSQVAVDFNADVKYEPELTEEPELKTEIDVEEPTLTFAGGFCGICANEYKFCACSIKMEEESSLHAVKLVSVPEYICPVIKEEFVDEGNSSSIPQPNEFGHKDPLMITLNDFIHQESLTKSLSCSTSLSTFEKFYKEKLSELSRSSDESFNSICSERFTGDDV